jgi:pyruvate/2-oxoglutarate/acetoin dehydrogenase E1 component
LTIDGVDWASAPRRVSLPDDLPIPYTPPLEDEVLPSADRIAEAARASVRG